REVDADGARRRRPKRERYRVGRYRERPGYAAGGRYRGPVRTGCGRTIARTQLPSEAGGGAAECLARAGEPACGVRSAYGFRAVPLHATGVRPATMGIASPMRTFAYQRQRRLTRAAIFEAGPPGGRRGRVRAR